MEQDPVAQAHRAPPTVPQPGNGRGRGLVLGVVVIAVIALAVGAFGWEELAPRLFGSDTTAAAPQDAQRMMVLEARLGRLEAAIARLEARPPSTSGADPAAVSALDARIDALDKTVRSAIDPEALARLAERAGRLSGDMSGLRERVERAERAAQTAATDVSANLAKQARMLFDYGALAARVRDGGSFAGALEALRAQIGTDSTAGELMEKLARDAASGLPTEDALEKQFAAAYRKAHAAAIRAADSSLWGRIKAIASSIVTIRRTGAIAEDVANSETDQTDAMLERIDAYLAQHDLGKAAAEADRLPAAAKAALAEWRAALQARLDGDETLGKLGDWLVKRFSTQPADSFATKG